MAHIILDLALTMISGIPIYKAVTLTIVVPG